MAKDSNTTIVMLTRLLEIRIEAKSRSGFARRRQAFLLLGSSFSLRSSMSDRESPKYAISLPETKADRNRQQQAIKTIMLHDSQLGGALNSTALESKIKSVREGDGKGSVSKIKIVLVSFAKLVNCDEISKYSLWNHGTTFITFPDFTYHINPVTFVMPVAEMMERIYSFT